MIEKITRNIGAIILIVVLIAILHQLFLLYRDLSVLIKQLLDKLEIL